MPDGMSPESPKILIAGKNMNIDQMRGSGSMPERNEPIPSFLDLQNELSRLKGHPDKDKETKLKLQRARLLNEAKSMGIFDTIKPLLSEIQAKFEFKDAYKEIANLDIDALEIQSKGLSGWKDQYSGMIEHYRDGALRNMEIALHEASGTQDDPKTAELKREKDLLGWGVPPRGLNQMLFQTPEQKKGALDPYEIGIGIAEAMGTPEPERDLETYRSAEEWGTPFSVSPGAEPRFMVLYQKNKEQWMRQRWIWEVRGLFAQARSQKELAASVDSLANPIDSDQARRLDPLGVGFKKERLEFIYREMPGLLAAKAIYTTIIGGPDFVGRTPAEREALRMSGKEEDVDLKPVNELLLSFDKDKLRWIYSSEELELLQKERDSLYYGTETNPKCPESIYGAKEPDFYVLRNSIRFFLRTKGAHLLFKDEADKEKVLNPKDDYQGMVEKKTEGQTVLERMSTRARDAEQVAWNFIFSTGMVESFNIPENNQYIRDHENKILGPSGFMTLYLWMLIHPQQRFEAKVLDRGSGDATQDEAKENWSSLGSWAANNIQKGSWRQTVDVVEKALDDKTKKPVKENGSFKRIHKKETRTVVPKFIRSDLIYDALREETRTKRAFFDFWTEKGIQILETPGDFSHNGLYAEMTKKEKGDPWYEVGDSPFVNYRFDRLRWAKTIYTVFKKGTDSGRDVSIEDLAEAKRKLGLTQTEVENLLIMRKGINVNSKELKPIKSSFDWKEWKMVEKRHHPDLFRDDSEKRKAL